MTGSLHVPVRPADAAQLADFLFQFAENRPVDEGLRRMLSARGALLATSESMQVYWESLAPDPTAKATFYVAVDSGAPLLLHIALSNAPASGIFPAPILIGRLRTPRGLEVVVNAIPFSPADRDRIVAYATHVDRSILPTPQGVDTLYIAACVDADTAFSQWRSVQRRYGLSVAAWTGDPHEGLWGAIRHGWREGYAMSGAYEMCSRVCLKADDPDLADAYDAAIRQNGRNFDVDLDFTGSGRPARPPEIATQLSALRDAGRPVRVVFAEIGLRPDGSYPASMSEMADWPEDVLSSVQWRAAGKPLVELSHRIEELQEVTRRYGAILGLRVNAAVGESVLDAIGRAASRRLWFELGPAFPPGMILELAGALRG
jgi:hypothetical protein